MSSKELTDIAVAVHAETDKALLISETGDPKRSVWLPKSQCEIERTDKFTYENGIAGRKKYPIIIVTLPEWLAINKELA